MIYIQGYFDRNNIGDEMLLMSYLEEVTCRVRVSSNRRFEWYPDYVEFDSRIGGLSAFKGKFDLLYKYINLFFRNARDCDKLVYCGGTQFTLSKRLKAITLLQLFQIYIFKFFGRQVEARGVGLIFHNSILNRSLLKMLFRGFDRIEVRDELSFKILQSINIVVEMGEDLVLQQRELFLVDDVQKQKSNIMLLTLPSSDYLRVAKFEEDIINLLEVLNAHGIKVVGLSMQEHENHSDSLCFERFGIDYIRAKSCFDIIDQIVQSKGVIGMRFHSCVIAHINSVKLLCLGDSVKVQTFGMKYSYLNWPYCSEKTVLQYLNS